MSRYIDADLMQDCLVEMNDENDWVVNKYNADWISSFIESQPEANVVEVVRCKDCLYAMKKYGHIECINGISYRNCWNQPDDYCRYGERADMRGDKR